MLEFYELTFPVRRWRRWRSICHHIYIIYRCGRWDIFQLWLWRQNRRENAALWHVCVFVFVKYKDCTSQTSDVSEMSSDVRRSITVIIYHDEFTHLEDFIIIVVTDQQTSSVLTNTENKLYCPCVVTWSSFSEPR